ncbi:MAG: quinone-dependent dihydroorotate dehydrogenase [Pseudomonadota bacterium]
MTEIFERLFRPVLFALDAERAHRMSVIGLKSGLVAQPAFSDPALQVEIAGLKFPNPVGIAAGYDKNAEALTGLGQLGFGFVEAGTVTPRPQPGNPKPRIFRLKQDYAVINRLGFNNHGHDRVNARVSKRASGAIVGVNIGANKDSENFVSDYVAGVRRFLHVADYLTVNISSPNTPGLRNLQARDALELLLKEVLNAREELQTNGSASKPIFLKIAPDLDQRELDDVAETILASGVDGVIVSNTTLNRDNLKSRNRTETGGLSGAPLFDLSTRVLARMRIRLRPDFPIIGVGGVDGPDTAWQKISAGANLVQLYTGLVYKGPKLPNLINQGLSQKLKVEGLKSITELSGRDVKSWAAEE